MRAVLCPECGQELQPLEAFREGEKLLCPRCHTRLEIIGLEPLEIDWAYKEPYDLWREMAVL